MNAYCAVGRLTRDPIVKFEGEGVQTATATLVIEEPGKLRAFRLFVPLRAWGKAAEGLSVRMAGELVSVQGKLAWYKKRDAHGQEHSALCVNVREVLVYEAGIRKGEDSCVTQAAMI